MKIESKIKMLTASLISAFVLIILFVAIQIGQERRMYQIEKRLDKIESVLFAEANNPNLLPDYHNIKWWENEWNPFYFPHEGTLHWKLNFITNSVTEINKKLDNMSVNANYHNIATVDPNDRNDWSTHYRVGQIRNTVYNIDTTLKNIDRKLDYRIINANSIYRPNTQEIIYGIDYNDAVVDYLDKILKEVTYIRKFK